MKKDTETPSLLRLQGIRKSFGGVHALQGVDFELRAGEIHALLGENGAGKTTLIKVLGGIHEPNAGSIVIDGQKVSIRGVADADRCGIRIIHQELSLAPNLSVAENIYLGREPHRFGLINRRTMYQQAERLIADLGLDEIREVRVEVSKLSVAHQQLVEIARALSAQARILVLDEPTSALSEAETEALFAALRRLRSQGVGIIYITHRLEEIARLADRVTVLRDGESIGTQSTRSRDRAP
jgi:ABC-type sugar transport system ATPase subunit